MPSGISGVRMREEAGTEGADKKTDTAVGEGSGGKFPLAKRKAEDGDEAVIGTRHINLLLKLSYI